ncbi:MAG: hypothetical protein AAF740_03595 [Bacteroidota bacterium]
MRTLLLKTLIIGLTIIGFSSCDEDCTNYLAPALIDRLEIRGDTIALNTSASYTITFGEESLTIDVFHFSLNDCGDFQSFRRSEQNIEPWIIYKGCDCNEISRIEASRYEFIPEERGDFTLNFLSENGESIILYILVE